MASYDCRGCTPPLRPPLVLPRPTYHARLAAMFLNDGGVGDLREGHHGVQRDEDAGQQRVQNVVHLLPEQEPARVDEVTHLWWNRVALFLREGTGSCCRACSREKQQ